MRIFLLATGVGALSAGVINGSFVTLLIGILLITAGLKIQSAYQRNGSSDLPPSDIPFLYRAQRSGSYIVCLTAPDPMKLGTGRALKRIFSATNTDVMSILCSAPVVLKKNISLSDAEYIKAHLEAVGARVLIIDTTSKELVRSSEGSYNIALVEAGKKRISVITVIQLLFNLDLTKASIIVDTTPTVLATGISREKMEEARAKLEGLGAIVKVDGPELQSQQVVPAAPAPPTISAPITPGQPTIPPPDVPAILQPSPRPSPQPSPAALARASEKYDVVLVSVAVNNNKVPIRRALKSLLGMDLVEAYNAVEKVPYVLKQDIYRTEAESLKKQLEAQGATIEIRKS